jgi:hypothetical protein
VTPSFAPTTPTSQPTQQPTWDPTKHPTIITNYGVHKLDEEGPGFQSMMGKWDN